MLENLSTSIFPLFLLATLAAFLFPFLKNKLYKQLSFKSFATTAPLFACVLVAFSALMLLGNLAGLNVGTYVACFAGGFAALYILNNIGLPTRLSGIVLLLCSVLLTLKLSSQTDAVGLIACACGIVVWKIVENLYWEIEPAFEDVVPALLWLVGVYWITLIGQQAMIATRESLLLGALSVMMLFRLFETPFLSDDKVYLKRLVLSATGGLFLLLVVTKLILSPHMETFALLFGGGLFVTYLLQELETREEKTVFDAFYILLLIGLATLVGYRLFGGLGLIILAVTTQIGKGNALAHYAGLFFAARILLQGFIIAWVPNVTGINTTHPYVGAALYGGMVLVLMLSIMARDVQSNKLYLLAFLSAGALVPVFGNYFLHEEATGAFLQVAGVSATLLAVIGPVLYQKEILKHGNIILLPTLLIGFACLSNGLIPIGNEATTTTKITVMAYAVTALLVISTLIGLLIKRSSGKSSGGNSGNQPVKVSGN